MEIRHRGCWWLAASKAANSIAWSGHQGSRASAVYSAAVHLDEGKQSGSQHSCPHPSLAAFTWATPAPCTMSRPGGRVMSTLEAQAAMPPS